MKKQKRIVVALIIGILFTIGMDFILLRKYNKNDNKDTYLNIEEFQYYKASYKCKKESELITNSDLNISFTALNEYQFEVKDDNTIQYGTFYENCQFNNKKDFDKFLQNVSEYNNTKIYVDKKKFLVIGVRSFIFPNTSNEDKLVFTDGYLNLLEDKGFVCEK